MQQQKRQVAKISREEKLVRLFAIIEMLKAYLEMFREKQKSTNTP